MLANVSDDRRHRWTIAAGIATCERCGTKRRAVLVLDSMGRLAASIESHGPPQCPGIPWWRAGAHRWSYDRTEPAAPWDVPSAPKAKSSPKRRAK